MAEVKKYELLKDDTITVDGHTLYRIRALYDFYINPDNELGVTVIEAGTLGGYIEDEKNLSHFGNCWVFSDAKVYFDACVFDDVLIYGNAQIYGTARVYGTAQVYGNAEVYGVSSVYGTAQVYGNAKVYGISCVCGCSSVSGYSNVLGYAVVTDCAKVFDESVVDGDFIGSTIINGNACICSDMRILSSHDYISVNGIGEFSNSSTTFYKRNDTIFTFCKCDTFEIYDSINEFLSRFDNGFVSDKCRQEFLLAIELAKLHFSDNKQR